jgi:hypothetical protein
MADVKYDQFIHRYAVEDNVRIAKYRHASMTRIIDETADLREETNVSIEDLIALRTLTVPAGLRSER